MKLLGWMHRKFRQNSTEPNFKDLVIGKAAVDEELHKYYYYMKPKFGSCKQTQKDQQFKLRKSYDEEEQLGGIFPGFLAIGTLGLMESDPSSTPTFSISVVEDIITEKEDAVTENELKVIKDELEKVLVLTNDELYDSSSARNSHVSSSTGESNNAICPLQGYLFGSALIETTTTTKNKEQHVHSHRTSLADLFQRSNQENLVGPKDHLSHTHNDKEDTHKSSMHLIIKKLKKNRILHASADTKLHNKILHMFHRKVHPENPTAAEKDNNKKKKRINEGGHNKSDKDSEEDIMIHPKRAVEKGNIGQCKKRQLQCSEEDSSENNKEQWIKTDADYLVLEL